MKEKAQIAEYTSADIKAVAIGALEDSKARDVVAIDIESLTVIADSFVICNGTSTTHIKALADSVEKALKNAFGLAVKRREGYNSARWILLDYGDVIIHVFHEKDRRFYDLERLWSDGVVTYSGANQP
jgi:ribosome-associated protein